MPFNPERRSLINRIRGFVHGRRNRNRNRNQTTPRRHDSRLDDNQPDEPIEPHNHVRRTYVFGPRQGSHRYYVYLVHYRDENTAWWMRNPTRAFYRAENAVSAAREVWATHLRSSWGAMAERSVIEADGEFFWCFEQAASDEDETRALVWVERVWVEDL